MKHWYSLEIEAEGGAWLGATRRYLQLHACLGDQLTWGSQDQVKGLTVYDVEKLAALAVAADRNERGS